MNSETRPKKNLRYLGALRPYVVLVFLIAAFGYGFSGCGGSEEQPAENTNQNSEVNEQAALPANLSNALEEKEKEGEDSAFAHFSHSSEYHKRLPCLACHKRDTNATRISFPGRVNHTPCAGCHTLQFANKNSSICTVCHVDPKEGSMKAFPSLGTFGAKFIHSRHSKVNCSTCHKPSGKTMTIPRAASAHATCFQCHSSNASNLMASCGTCHQHGAGRMEVPGRAKAFRANFSHAKHGESQNLNCATCHSLNSRGAGRNQMSAPATVMHFPKEGTLSCGTCHNGKRAFGADDFANCKRCHQGNSFRF